jgi:hypothetical protein
MRVPFSETVGFTRKHPALCLLGGSALCALISVGAFHEAGHQSDQRDALLAAAQTANIASFTYENKARQPSQDPKLVAQNYEQAVAQAQLAYQYAEAADTDLANRQGDLAWVLATGGASIVLGLSAGAVALARHDRANLRSF